MPLTKKSVSLTLLLLGCLALGAGWGVYYIALALTPSAAAFWVAGGAAIAVFLVRLFRQTALVPRIRAQKRVAAVGLLVVVLALLVVLVNYVGAVYSHRFDLTRHRQHTLDQGTLDVIQALDDQIKITLLYVGIPPVSLKDMLAEYEKQGRGTITTEIVDPLQNIGYASRFGTTITGKERRLIVTAGQQRRDIDFTGRMVSEEEVTNAIMRVTRDQRKAYFLTGHREYRIDDSKDTGLSVFNELLRSNQVTTEELLLTGGTPIPEDADVLVVAGPRDFLSEAETAAIKSFLNDGGDALFLIENTVITPADQPLTEEQRERNPDLNEILMDWGVRVYPDIVVDLANHAGQDVGCPATRNYMPHPALIKGLDYTFYIRPRSISMLKNRPANLKVAPFVLTSSDPPHSWAETNRHLKVKLDDKDKPGPVPISYVIWRKNPKRSDTQIIVFSDADFLSNAYISQYSNARMGINVINWLTEADYQAFMNEDPRKPPRLDLTSRQKRIVTVILVALPLAVALAGLCVWINRRE
jgi:hypothetical protein